MSTSKRLPAFEKFIQAARAFCAQSSDTEARMKRIKILLEGLVADPTMRAHAKNWPCTEGHNNLLLYEDSDYDFVINAVVRNPGREGRVHDHAHAVDGEHAEPQQHDGAEEARDPLDRKSTRLNSSHRT